uniref:Uncharacterized protein n=1 Tax=Micrurus lemniscatus lemniscatus TaxID=129467 RepID=A0A2D4I782_MICLE
MAEPTAIITEWAAPSPVVRAREGSFHLPSKVQPSPTVGEWNLSPNSLASSGIWKWRLVFSKSRTSLEMLYSLPFTPPPLGRTNKTSPVPSTLILHLKTATMPSSLAHHVSGLSQDPSGFLQQPLQWEFPSPAVYTITSLEETNEKPPPPLLPHNPTKE